MLDVGYTLMGEQRSPKDLVRDAVLAEQAGFDFMVASDHYSPWLEVQGHSPYTWSVLGAVAQATERIPFMTYVTCPIVRYHPAVVAQKAATVQLLADGRFTLGLGSGENLNEHVVGERWPAVATRQDMLEEAIEVIRLCWSGERQVSFEGEHYRLDGHTPGPPPAHDAGIWLGAYGPRMLRLVGRAADGWLPTISRRASGRAAATSGHTSFTSHAAPASFGA